MSADLQLPAPAAALTCIEAPVGAPWSQAAPFLPCEYRVRWADSEWEQAGAQALRRAVFCIEQGVFPGDDRDAIDEHAQCLVALAVVGGVPDAVVGTVRIHQAEPGVWWGSRLAVHPSFRHLGRIGATLIRLAVGSAHARGCMRFLAHVQSQNAALFERLHWRTLDTLSLHGRPHHWMQADLAHYPPCADPHAGYVTRAGA
jgi:putative N-acetyltransferase (TIGR04045 family)